MANRVRLIGRFLVAAVVCALTILLVVGLWSLLQDEAPIKPFATVPRTSSAAPEPSAAPADR